MRFLQAVGFMAAGKRAQCKALARDQDPWHAHMEQALADRNGRVIQSTSDEAPGLLAYVEHPLGAHHSPNLFHVQHELSQAYQFRWPPNSGLPPRQKRRSSKRTSTSMIVKPSCKL